MRKLFILSVIFLASCTAIRDIFKAGTWTGIFIAMMVFLALVFALSLFKKKDR